MKALFLIFSWLVLTPTLANGQFDQKFHELTITTQIKTSTIANIFAYDKIHFPSNRKAVLGYCPKQQAYCLRHLQAQNELKILPSGIEWLKLHVIGHNSGWIYGVYTNAKNRIALLPFAITIQHSVIKLGTVLDVTSNGRQIKSLWIQAQGLSALQSKSFLSFQGKKIIVNGGRSYNLVVWDRQKGTMVPIDNPSFDIYGNSNEAQRLANILNAQQENRFIALFSWDEPRNNRLAPTLKAAIKRCGGGPVFEYQGFKFRGAYILLGVCSNSANNRQGYEFYAGDKDSDPQATLELILALVDGNLVIPESCRQYREAESNSASGIYSLSNKRLAFCQFLADGTVRQIPFDPNNPVFGSCRDVQHRGFDVSKIYLIDPDGVGGEPAFEVYCDLQQAGGGWTLIASNAHTNVWNPTSVLQNTPFGNVHKYRREDFKSPAFSQLPFTELLFTNGQQYAVYKINTRPQTSFYHLQNSLHPNCGRNHYSMTRGTFTHNTLCNSHLYFHSYDADGVSDRCRVKPHSTDHATGPHWSMNSNEGCPLDDPSSSSFINSKSLWGNQALLLFAR